jgi:GTP cyclohydrolase I
MSNGAIEGFTDAMRELRRALGCHLGRSDAVEHVRRALDSLGADVAEEHLRDTPRRIVDVWSEFLGASREPDFSFTAFENPGIDQIIVARNVQVTGLCPHHLLAWQGRAHVAYIPHEKIVGISKLVRVAQWAAKRAATQEEVTQLIADTVEKRLSPLGTAAIVEGAHTCVTCRGAQDDDVEFVTSVMRKMFMSNPAARQELLALIAQGGRP